jgi:hypothetical protein
MLRVLIGLLMAANALVWAWQQDLLARVGWPAQPPAQGAAIPEEALAPERIIPDANGDAPPPVAALAPSDALAINPTPASWACWRLGPYAVSLQGRLQKVLPLNSPQVSWTLVDTVLPQRWVVVSERTTSAKELAALTERAKQAQVDHRTSDADVLKGRLILGTFVNRDLAVNALSRMLEGGWGPLSVMRERPPVSALLVEARVSNEAALSSLKTWLAPVELLGRNSLQILPCEEPTPSALLESTDAATAPKL